MKLKLFWVLLWASLFYLSFGFSFGYGNNVEELPLIYKISGIATYPGDPFVETTLSSYSYLTVYVEFVGRLGQVLSLSNFYPLYFVLHFLCLLSLIFSLTFLFEQLKIKHYSTHFVLISLLLFAEKTLHVVPNARAIFWTILDPEFVAISFLFWSLAYFVKESYKYSTIFLILSSLAHPLYALQLLLIYSLVILWELFRGCASLSYSVKQIVTLSCFVLPYCLFLKSIYHADLSVVDVSFVHEIVRAPKHLVIPSARSSNWSDYLPFISALGVMLTSVYMLKGSPLPESRRLKHVCYALSLYLLLTSFISSFVRIEQLVTLTPYRIGMVALVSAYSLLATKLSSAFARPYVRNVSIMFCLICFALFAYEKREVKASRSDVSSSRRAVIEWVGASTGEADKFINYSDIDLRTQALRSDFFRFKTFPVFESSQLEWYQRLLTYYDIPSSVEVDDYTKVSNLLSGNSHEVDVQRFLQKVKYWKPSYLLISRQSKPKVVNTDRLRKVFSNKHYEVFAAM